MNILSQKSSSWGIWSSLMFICLLFASCGGPNGRTYAEKLCGCSDAFSKAAIQLKTETIDQATFDRLQAEHNICMGDDDPLERLQENPTALVQFKAEFLNALEEQCPEIARNMGY
jgi:hypothetical protein